MHVMFWVDDDHVSVKLARFCDFRVIVLQGRGRVLRSRNLLTLSSLRGNREHWVRHTLIGDGAVGRMDRNWRALVTQEKQGCGRTKHQQNDHDAQHRWPSIETERSMVAAQR